MPSPEVLEVVELRNERIPLQEAIKIAAESHACSVSVLKSRYYRQQGKEAEQVKTHGNSKLTDDEELALVSLLAAFLELGKG